MLNINGLVKVTKIEDLEGSKATKGTIYFGTKKGKNSEEWENSFFNAVFIGKAFDKIGVVAEKESIFITEGLVKNVSYQDKQGNNRSCLSLTVFDFIHGEEEIKQYMNSKFGKKEEKQEKPQRQPRGKK
jgi:single-stranded DNA-binding protein